MAFLSFFRTFLIYQKNNLLPVAFRKLKYKFLSNRELIRPKSFKYLKHDKVIHKLSCFETKLNALKLKLILRVCIDSQKLQLHVISRSNNSLEYYPHVNPPTDELLWAFLREYFCSLVINEEKVMKNPLVNKSCPYSPMTSVPSIG